MAKHTRLNTEDKKILANIPEEKRHIGRKLIEELKFLEETLEALRAEIKANGVIEDFQNGRQKFKRESSALKVYNTTIQRYSTLNKQLSDLMKCDAPQEGSDLLDFITEG